MALFQNPEHQIGRGEVPESRVEIPFFFALIVFASIALLITHTYVRVSGITLALAINLLVFGATVLRVDFGVYLLVIAMLLSPEIQTAPEGRAFRAVNIRYDDVLIVVVFLGVMVKQTWEGKHVLWRPCPINRGIYSYYAVCIISCLLALRNDVPLWDEKSAALVMLKMAEFYMIFFMVGSAIRNLDQVRKQLILFFLVAIIVSVYALYSRAGAMERVGAPFEKGGTEPNTLGGYLVIVMCVASGLFIYAPTRFKRLLTFAVFLTAFLPFVFTLSRASYIAFLAALVVFGVVFRSKAILLCLAAILILFPFVAPKDVQDRVNYTFQRGSGEDVVIAGRDTGLNVDKSTYERIYVWQKVRYNLRVWPWFGGGITWDRVLDSQYALVIIETGLFGLAAFVFMQFRLLKTLRQAYLWSHDWLAKGLCVGVFTTTIALMVHSMGTISFLIVRIMEPYWFLVALAVVARDIAIQEHFQRKRAAEQAQVAAKPQPSGSLPVPSTQPAR